MTSPGGVRSARTEQTRAAIVAAAHDLFVAHGYRATSLRDIAAAAGISHPGLLRHFPTKDALLAEVVDSFERDNEFELLHQLAADEPGTLGYSMLARRNETVPGYLPLFAALTGEASSPRHPAHEIMRDRYARLEALSAEVFDDAITQGTVAPDRDPVGEAVRTAAAWDGLQLLAQYLPGQVDVAAMLETHEVSLAYPVGWRDPDDPPPVAASQPVPSLLQPPADDAVPTIGYRVGRERRAGILDSAMALFAQEGYGDTSLRDIAERVGVSKSTLLHYYSSKEELLSAVLAHRDHLIQSRESYARATRSADELRNLPRGAADNARSGPGLIEMYAVLSCEAVPVEHPAHDYFAQRFRRVIDQFTALLRAAQADGDLPLHRDPALEALWLTALWDGLQYQWLYDRDGVDVAAELTAHLDDVLPRR
jgi:AcrR family transcriptional regulator